MSNRFQLGDFGEIIEQTAAFAVTQQAKERILDLQPYLSQAEAIREGKETTEARKILDMVGDPPLTAMKDIHTLLETAEKGGMLTVEELEHLAVTLTGVRRLKDFLERCKYLELGLPYYADELDSLEELREEITQNLRNGRIEDDATPDLKSIRWGIERIQYKIREKADSLLRIHKEICADSFVSNRNGHLCLPVKKEYKSKVDGSVIDKSATGNTLFIEPRVLSNINQELLQLQMEEENEERKILYTLTGMAAEQSEVFIKNAVLAAQLDFAFAKGKLSAKQNAVPADLHMGRDICIKQARHPLLKKEECIPLDFCMENGVRGVVITGPNTGGKTVALKTVALCSMMAQSGLHVPCEEARICMNSAVLCDIGDGQNISENLSTFSAHIKNVLFILSHADRESLVILDELGSGTDPAEGMGIAIAILEELRQSGCDFIATTHYPEVKRYADQAEYLINARMGFDQETLRPLYQLELGRAGESCALHIAKCLGMSEKMLHRAETAAYGGKLPAREAAAKREQMPKGSSLLIPKQAAKAVSHRAESFAIGDSVMVYPEQKIGIVCKSADEYGQIWVQMKKEKRMVNHKRLKLHVAASELYPEDYDFSILFDSVENRKARHEMDKRYRPDLTIQIPEEGF